MTLHVDTDALAYEDALGVIDAMYDQALEELSQPNGDVPSELIVRVETLDEARRNLFTHAVEESV